MALPPPSVGSLPGGDLSIPVRIRSQDGRSGAGGMVRYAQPSLGQRLRQAGKLLLIGLVAVVVFLPVPLMHLVGVLVFLLMSYLAVRRLRSPLVVKSARGRCPACASEGSYYVGFGNQRLSFPIVTSCPLCSIGLELEPEPGGLPRG